jgi:hypothetical protein
MSGPFVFTFRARYSPGERDRYLASCMECVEVVETEEPRVIAFNMWENADGTETSAIQVHPDVESLEHHFKIFTERLAAKVEGTIDVLEYSIYGEPTQAVLDVLQFAPDADVRIHSRHLGGFLRPQPL